MKYTLSHNLRFLLWTRDASPIKWPQILAELLDIPKERAQALLDDDSPKPEELATIAAALDVSPDELNTIELWPRAQEDVLKANLARVLGELERGANKVVAAQAGVNQVTLSRWKGGEQVPEAKPLDRLAQALGLKDGEALRAEPLFLSPRPLTIEARRKGVIERVQLMGSDELRLLLPALEKLTD